MDVDASILDALENAGRDEEAKGDSYYEVDWLAARFWQ
jgi:hypothetical protein